jgi:transcriptional regulator with XRE-family HTH domain
MTRLRDLRQQRLLSIRDLAKAAGVSPQTIVTIEAGERPPRPSTMRKIAAALGIEAREVDEFARSIDAWTAASS